MKMNLKHTKKWSRLRGAMLAAPLALVAGGLLVADVPSKLVEESPVVSKEKLDVANSLSDAFRGVAKRVLPAVVSIENRPKVNWQTSQREVPQNRGPEGNPFKGTPFEDFFGDQFQMPMRPMPSPHPRSGIGSGVIVDASGIILTNHHVVAGDGTVTVRLSDGSEFEASEVMTDPQSDIAVVKINSDSPLPFARLGDSDSTEVGDWVVALGQPFGLESTVTAGIVSAKNRGIGIADRENFIQTDAAINPGNSGGPLVNLQGEVVGINTAIKSSDGGNNGIGFAVPANLAKWVKDQLLVDGKVHRSYLGVGIQPVNFELANQFNVAPRSGVVVTNVLPGTPAEDAGLEAGDIIVEFGGEKITSPQQLQIAVERCPAGEKAEIEILRDGESMQLTYRGVEAPSDFGGRSQQSQRSERKNESRLGSLGLEVGEMTPEVAKQLGLEGQKGLVVTSVQQGSPADRAGLESGMMIAQVNRQEVTSIDEFESIVDSDEDGSILLLVRTEQGSRFVVLEK